jgi:hypothetical protein
MVQILIAWIYITAISWAWGYLLMKLFKVVLKQTEPFLPIFSITCFAGLSLLAVIAGFLSLVIPLGGIIVQLIILAPVIIVALSDKTMPAIFYLQLQSFFVWRSKSVCCFFLLFLLMVLVLNTWIITHPDTLGYHLQTTLWIEDYKAVPGIVHLHTRYGYQGLWFVLCGMFSFKFTHTSSATFINSTVVFWYLFFIAKEIDKLYINSTPKKIARGMLYLLLLAVNFWDFGQIRLTASSLSPDFIAALYIWLIFYLVFHPIDAKDNKSSFLLIFFLSTVAIGIKLSSIAACFFILYASIKLYFFAGKRIVNYLVILMIISIAPFLLRNMIASGYLLFPSPFPDIGNFDWKLSKQLTQLEKDYITAYARIGPVSGKKQIELVSKMKLKDWLPVWWHNRSYAEKFYLSSLIAVLLVNIALASLIVKSIGREKTFICFFVTAVALSIWFVNAPDPRFVFGFLIPLQGICFNFLAERYISSYKLQKGMLQKSIVLFCLVIAGYTVYRCIHYFKPENLLSPSGVLKTAYMQVNCNGIRINIPLTESGCGDLTVPCSENNCSDFTLRGKNLNTGFKAVK